MQQFHLQFKKLNKYQAFKKMEVLMLIEEYLRVLQQTCRIAHAAQICTPGNAKQSSSG